MRTDYFQRFEFSRAWHPDWRLELRCPLVRDPWVAVPERALLPHWVVLKVSFKSGQVSYMSVKLKPSDWMSLDKEAYIDSNVDRVGYTYMDDGPIGYRRSTLEAAIHCVLDISSVDEKSWPTIVGQLSINQFSDFVQLCDEATWVLSPKMRLNS